MKQKHYSYSFPLPQWLQDAKDQITLNWILELEKHQMAYWKFAGFSKHKREWVYPDSMQVGSKDVLALLDQTERLAELIQELLNDKGEVWNLNTDWISSRTRMQAELNRCRDKPLDLESRVKRLEDKVL